MSYPGLCSWCGCDTGGFWSVCDQCNAITEGIENGTHCKHGNLIPYVKDKFGCIGTDLECSECQQEKAHAQHKVA